MSDPAPLDLTVLKLLYAGPVPGWVAEVAAVVTVLGSGWMLLGLVPALLAREHRPWALRLLGAILGTAALVAGLKAIVGRVRPCNALAWAPAVVASAPHDPSFPSGHAAGSFAFAAFVVMLDRRWGALAVALATLVGLSRIALGVHWPTDVLAGAIVGASIGGWVGRRAATARSAALLGG